MTLIDLCQYCPKPKECCGGCPHNKKPEELPVMFNQKETKMKNTYSGEVIQGHNGPVFKMSDGRDFLSLGGIEADTYPLGTRVTITLEEPEPPKERVVLPEGMKWDVADLLWTADGTLIASASCGYSWYCVPFMLLKITIDSCESTENAKRVIENALAEHNYFGVRKVVNNE